MQKLVTGMKNNGGFTLIEILVVLLIIGITLGFALLAFGDFGSNRRIVIAAEQFVNYVKFIQQEAIMQTSTLGIIFNQTGYHVIRFESGHHWQTMPNKNIFHQQRFPSNAVVRFENSSTKIGEPSIIINAAGDMTAFKLNFSSKNQMNIADVIGESDGTLALRVQDSQ